MISRRALVGSGLLAFLPILLKPALGAETAACHELAYLDGLVERSPSFLLRCKLAREIAAVQFRARRLTAREQRDRLEEYRGYIAQSAAALSRVDPLADLQDAFYHQRLCLNHVMGFADLMAERSPGSAWLSNKAIRLRTSGMRLLAGIERLERRYYGDDLRRGSDEALRLLVADTF